MILVWRVQNRLDLTGTQTRVRTQNLGRVHYAFTLLNVPFRLHPSTPSSPVPRITSLIRRQGDTRFARRILSKKELALWSHIPHDQATVRTQFLAVRYALIARTDVYGEITYQCSWSIKEAAYKAVFPTIRPAWKEFTFHPLSDDGNRKPLLEYHPLETSSISVGKFHASVSHDGDYIFSTVLVQNT